MDRVLLAASFAVPLFVTLVGAIWLLVASSRRERRERVPTGHVLQGQGEAVTVAELLEEAIEQGEPIRLNWSEDNVDAVGRVRPYVQNEFPTAVLPRIEDGKLDVRR